MKTENESRIKILSVIALITTAAIWGSAFAVMKNSVAIIPPTYLLALRFTIATAGLILAFSKHVKTIGKSDLICGSILGFFLFISYFFQTYGLAYTTASKNAFITTLYVILVPYLHWILNKKKPSNSQIKAAVIAVAGLALLSLERDLSVNIGDFLTLICGAFFACHIVFIDRYTVDHDPVKLTVIQMAVASILSWIVAPVLEGKLDVTVITGSTLIGLLYLGIFSTMISYLLQNVGQKNLSPNTSSIILSFEAVFGLIFSVLILGEVVTLKIAAGCILMFLSVLLTEYKRKNRSKTDPSN
ncbi:DMT family transporter [Clostridium sp. E02]|uniref:DMT family transporter n=1 Tax=Clostridium sp. E02 TaxID=2487134 RepID=UPI000F5439B6|nr:DMT family transporter [Clostridium sp. E02]